MTGRFNGTCKRLGVSVERYLDRRGYGQLDRAYEAAASVRECPGGCEESKLPVDVDGELIWIPCPLLSPGCGRGKELEAALCNYCLSHVRAISSLPTRFHGLLARPCRTDAVAGGSLWARSPEPATFLVLYGGQGVGKSFAAAYL